ncbi:LuxR C-terminal-related transcriptional regulator [Paraburkholderia denitrificans]|uniref:LuxR C-terminal-related transcriptional regulator n=1 Tax=Paraburkholderia denitrificans TaxID=694025 RepID=A0ABW0JD75_9BURK
MSNAFTSLISTRFAPPEGKGLLPRERLLVWLESERQRKLILLSGPAGSGKTSLAALWRKSLIARGDSVVWYNVSADDDPVQFATYLAAGLESLDGHVGQDAKSILNRFGIGALDAFAAAVINDLHQFSKPVYLVLEDFHEVAATPIRHLLEKLLAWAPSNLHVVLTSRLAQPFPLSELRAHDEIAELDFTALRFDLSETETFLRSQGVGPLDIATVREVHDRTDGWAAGVQLVAYSIRNTRNVRPGSLSIPARPVSRNGDIVDDYFNQLVNDNLSPEELAFLVHTAACRLFNRGLCEIITANPRAGELLRKFESENLFIVPIESQGDAEPWYRFHPLFGKYLRDRLCRLPEDELININVAAGRWFAGKGLYAQAIRHSRYAGDMNLCVELVERVARPMVVQGEYFQLRKWIGALPRNTLLTRLELLLCAAWAELACGDLDAARHLLADIEAHPQNSTVDTLRESALLRSWCLLKQDDTAAALDVLSPYESLPATVDPLVAFGIRNVLAAALAHAGQFERARDVLMPAGRMMSAEQTIFTPVVARGVVALTYVIQGAYRQASDVMHKAIEEIEARRTGKAEFDGITAGFAIAAAYAKNDLVEAESMLLEHLQLIELMCIPDCIIEAHMARVKILRAENRLDDALRVLNRADELAARLSLDRLYARALAERTSVEIDRGNRPAARQAQRQLQQLAAEYKEQANCAWAEIGFYAASGEAMLAMIDGNFDRALDLCRQLLETSVVHGRLGQTAALHVREAIALWSLHHEQAAVAAMRQAVSIAAPHRMVRHFLDEGAIALRLLELVKSRSDISADEFDFIAQVLMAGASGQSYSESTEARTKQPAHSNVVRLSPRELEILTLVSNAFSNKSIAKTLNCSDLTVKWHVKNIFTKLGAVSREDASVKARELGLLR